MPALPAAPAHLAARDPPAARPPSPSHDLLATPLPTVPQQPAWYVDAADAIPLLPDIGAYVGTCGRSDALQLALLKRRWKPSSPDEFPSSSKKGKQDKEELRRISSKHLDMYPWLAISQHEDKTGAWCVDCVLFSTDTRPGQRLVACPLVNFARLTGKEGALSSHDASVAHKKNAERASQFVKRVEGEVDNVYVQQTSSDEAQRQANSAALESIVDIVTTLVTQNVPLRGHRDDGRIDPAAERAPVNDGNFREISRLTMRHGNMALQDHLRTAPENATYTSKTTQNEIIR